MSPAAIQPPAKAIRRRYGIVSTARSGGKSAGIPGLSVRTPQGRLIGLHACAHNS